jgi:hypothetical protein
MSSEIKTKKKFYYKRFRKEVFDGIREGNGDKSDYKDCFHSQKHRQLLYSGSRLMG